MSIQNVIVDRARRSLKDRSTQLAQTKPGWRPPAHYKVQEIVYFNKTKWFIFGVEWGGDNRFLGVNDWVYSLRVINAPGEGIDQPCAEKFVTETKLNELTK